ncbi:MAG: ankyrin repeat domain-containing protein [Candidatus Comchoanobacterales bacterium]
MQFHGYINWLKTQENGLNDHALLARAMQEKNQDIIIYIVNMIHNKEKKRWWRWLMPFSTSIKYHQLFYWVCIHDAHKVLDYLIRSKKINLNKSIGPECLTPLMIAMRYHCHHVLEKILDYTELNVNARDKNGMTALMHAIVWRSDSGIQMLFSHPDIDVNIMDKKNNHALSLSIKCQYHEAFEYLLRHPKINIEQPVDGGVPPIMVLLMCQDQRMLRMLLKLHTHALKNNRLASDPLFAVQTPALLKLILHHDPACVNAKNAYGESLLHTYCRRGWTQMVKQLLTTKKIDVNAKDAYLRSPLMVAIQSRRDEVVSLLIQDDRINFYAADTLGRSVADYVNDSSEHIKEIFR